ncbi:hypothetical protein PTT_14606 [Pyrenophora teres f. teres 0-1]|uniref:Cupin type-2 domain-containing protein n=1 Tax=Pyrenophora teres f. teres (strain 0-1) TaxID=861557 RepID=E3RYI4_PYRTT|nr:hypothetical protein PTT_14606 [Pyrenophora teres f. teres 0-1]CAA9965304.1 cupin domain-containing protein [Pyrenophora teres f. maculata]
MPGEVYVKKASDIQAPDGPQTDGMIRMPAIVDKSDQICGTVMVAKPHTSSAVHHHGEEDTIVYAAKGHGAIVSGPDGNKRQELAPGDFALIPAYAEHQEVNDSDEEVVWIITRGGRNPVVHNLEGWTRD